MTERAAAEKRAREIARDMTSLAIKGRTGVRVWSTEKNQRRAAMLTAYFEKALLAARAEGRAEGVEDAAKVAEGGSFLHDAAPDALFGRACAAAIRALCPASTGQVKP